MAPRRERLTRANTEALAKQLEKLGAHVLAAEAREASLRGAREPRAGRRRLVSSTS